MPVGHRSAATAYWEKLESQGMSGIHPFQLHKAAACATDKCVYIFGGKNTNTNFKDLWELDYDTKIWKKITSQGDRPPSLQGHSMLHYKRNLYVFGGNFSYGGTFDVPLWTFQLDSKQWEKYDSIDLDIVKEVQLPGCRRHHSAVLYRGLMIVYGGYIDLKGSTSDMWIYNLTTKLWSRQMPVQTSGACPSPRYGHIAVVQDRSMWVHGGMMDLSPLSDLWRYLLDLKIWQHIRCHDSAPVLSEHTAISTHKYLLTIGGLTNGSPMQDIWIFTYATEVWSKANLSSCSQVPPVIWQHSSVLLKSPKDSNKPETEVKAISHPFLKENCKSISEDAFFDRPHTSPANTQTKGNDASCYSFQTNRVSPVMKEDMKPVDGRTSGGGDCLEMVVMNSAHILTIGTNCNDAINTGGKIAVKRRKQKRRSSGESHDSASDCETRKLVQTKQVTGGTGYKNPMFLKSISQKSLVSNGGDIVKENGKVIARKQKAKHTKSSAVTELQQQQTKNVLCKGEKNNIQNSPECSEIYRNDNDLVLIDLERSDCSDEELLSKSNILHPDYPRRFSRDLLEGFDMELQECFPRLKLSSINSEYLPKYHQNGCVKQDMCNEIESTAFSCNGYSSVLTDTATITKTPANHSTNQHSGVNAYKETTRDGSVGTSTGTYCETNNCIQPDILQPQCSQYEIIVLGGKQSEQSNIGFGTLSMYKLIMSV